MDLNPYGNPQNKNLAPKACACAAHRGLRRATASASTSAMAVPPAPSPANINVCSARSRPVSGAAASTPASTTAAVPCSNSQHHAVASEFLEVYFSFRLLGQYPCQHHRRRALQEPNLDLLEHFTSRN